MDELIKSWSGESVISRYEPAFETWMFIAIHSTTLGTATGGTRFKRYPEPRDALRDAMRLAEGMTYKWAGIGFPRGGGKAVLAPGRQLEPAEKDALFTRYGAWLADLNRIFETGPDMGTSPREMDLIRKSFPGVFGCTEEAGGKGNPGPFTALGVFSGIRASCAHKFGTPDLSDRSVLIQGTGSVGEPLIRYLLDEGCTVQFADVDAERARKLQAHFGLEVIDPAEIYSQPCDVFAPCAIGGILTSETIPALQCSVVAGGANNQLESGDLANELRARDILYAPDFIINAGGALYLLSVENMGWTVEQARAEIQKIGETLTKIFSAADELGIDTAQAAIQLATDRIRQKGQADA